MMNDEEMANVRTGKEWKAEGRQRQADSYGAEDSVGEEGGRVLC